MIPIPHINTFKNLSKIQIKFIKRLGLKKYRALENKFILQGEKNIKLLIQSPYNVTLVVGTSNFLRENKEVLHQKNIPYFEATPALLHAIGTLEENTSALAIATPGILNPITIKDQQYGLVLDGINNPGNLGTILRIADWYGLKGVICSLDTVELYNPKVLQASMGSFLQVPIYYTELSSYLSHAQVPIMGAFTKGENLHDPVTKWPTSGLIVIGNEAHGIRTTLLPYIHQRISIPRYGQAESLNAAVATAVLCDNLIRAKNMP